MILYHILKSSFFLSLVPTATSITISIIERDPGKMLSQNAKMENNLLYLHGAFHLQRTFTLRTHLYINFFDATPHQIGAH